MDSRLINGLIHRLISITSDISVLYPFEVESSNTNKTYSYLDTSGRPTITLHKTACSENHAQDVVVSYKFNTLDLLQKPAAVAGLALVAFVLFGLSRKVNWSIKSDSGATGKIVLK